MTEWTQNGVAIQPLSIEETLRGSVKLLHGRRHRLQMSPAIGALRWESVARPGHGAEVDLAENEMAPARYVCCNGNQLPLAGELEISCRP